MNEHLTVEINETLKFKKVTCTEGHYITNWDKVDILDYTSARIMFCPLTTDLEPFYCVTEEEHLAYTEERRKAEEEQRIAEENNVENQ